MGRSFRDLEGKEVYETLVANFSGAKFKPILMLKRDKYTEHGKAAPNKFLFCTLYLQGFKGGSCLSTMMEISTASK
ncbi:MAG: hypothetical protein KGS72_12970 [Cyanobacteria bacterium REEB67]|nr:hypothetical protein [Cyanobacteria bacterium REEB67]